MTLKSYGVKEKTPSGDKTARAVEELSLVGFTVLDSGYSQEEQNAFKDAFVRAYDKQCASHGGREVLKLIHEHNTIRAPLFYEEAFRRLAQNANVLRVAEALFGGGHESGTYVLNQQNGIINPSWQSYEQAAFHRDLPYQHFVSSRPLAISALYCLDAFTAENGATQVLPGSHKMERFPSDETVAKLATPLTASAGSFLILDCMLFHSGGRNQTGADRRAVNNFYSLPIIRRQINFTFDGNAVNSLSEAEKKLFGVTPPEINSIADYYAYRRSQHMT